MFHAYKVLKNSLSIPSSLSSTSWTPPNAIPRPLWYAMVDPAREGLGAFAGFFLRSHLTVGGAVGNASAPG